MMRKSSVNEIIIDILSREGVHLTSLQIYQLAKKQLPAVNRSTIYRALERLANNGIVSISDMGLGSSVYELVSEDRHHHLVCQECGMITMFADKDVRYFFLTIAGKHQFIVKTNHLILFGICKACQQSSNQ